MDLRDAIQRIALEWPSYGRPRITAELRRRGVELAQMPEEAIAPHRLLRALRRAQRKLPLIVITARDDMASTVSAVQLGAFDYVVKPPEVDRLKLLVRRAVDQCADAVFLVAGRADL